MTSLWKNYDAKSSYDEYLTPERKLRKEAKIISSILDRHGKKKLQEIDRNCMSTIDSRGINFKVYSADKKAAEEKKWPLDIIPRIVLKSKWNKVKKGLIQRSKSLNLFIDDVYNKKRIFKDKIIPEDIVFKSKNYLKQCEGFSPKRKIWSHISGIDLIRNIRGDFLVLEDNLQVPSGVSYMLENRMVMSQVFPQIFTRYRVSPIGHYCNRLYHFQRIDLFPPQVLHPFVVLKKNVQNRQSYKYQVLKQPYADFLFGMESHHAYNDKVYYNNDQLAKLCIV